MNMTSLLKSSLNGLSGSSSEAVAEGAGRATGEMASGEGARRDPEVVAIARRRQFSGSEKRRLLAEAERCKDAGTLGAFLRREHIYSSMISGWRKQIGMANQAALAPKRRGPKPDASARQIQQLERDNARLRHKLEQAELIIDAQKKLCVALGLPTADVRSGAACPPSVPGVAGPCHAAHRRCGHGPPWRSRAPSRIYCWDFSTASALRTWRRPRSSPRCSMKAALTARSLRCIGSL